MPWFKSFLPRLPRGRYWPLYAIAVGYFLWAVVNFYVPGKGFSSLAYFGGNPGLHRIREMQSLDYYVYLDSNGYDGQYYAQMAVKPLLGSRDLRRAVDNLPYRARRILFCWTAHLAGLGRPSLILQAYALQNIAAWLLLGWLLLRWFPPTGPGNAVRWLGTMFAWGLTMSVRQALMDGPSLLLIAWGVALAEDGRRWSSACVLGAAGLGRETNALAGVMHVPGRDWSRRELRGAAGRLFVAGAPLALWLAYLWWRFDEPSNVGARNLAAPFEGFFQKWMEAVADYRANGWDSNAKWSLVLMASLTVQGAVVLLKPRWSDAWWRIGATYGVLMLCLGEAVWEGFPGAAARVLVPLTLAFNIVVPRGWRWGLVLVAGNLSMITAFDQLKAPGRESFLLEGPPEVWQAPANHSIEVVFDRGWYQSERSSFEYWRWSRGSAGMIVHNPQVVPVEVELSFDMKAFDDRKVRVYQGKALRWEGLVGRDRAAVLLRGVRLEPGDNPWRFEADGPPSYPNGDRLRPVTFNLRNLVIRAVRRI